MPEITVDELRSLTIVQVTEGEFSTKIEVYHPHNGFGKLMPSRINWAACGSQSPKDTKAFIEGLCKAIEIAEDLDSIVAKDKNHA